MTESQLIPKQWAVPSEIRARLGDEVGRQRAMTHDGHLLLLLHTPPKVDETTRRGRVMWRSPESVWAPKALKHGESPVSELLGEYEKVLDELDGEEDQARSAAEYFDLLTPLNPIVRSAHNLHNALQQAREKLPDARELILLRDRAYSVARRAELMQADAKNTLDFVIAKRAEEGAAASERQANAAHRLNVLAAFTFPLLTLCAIFGSNLGHGLEQWDAAAAPTPILAVTGVGLVLGAILAALVTSR